MSDKYISPKVKAYTDNYIPYFKELERLSNITKENLTIKNFEVFEKQCQEVINDLMSHLINQLQK